MTLTLRSASADGIAHLDTEVAGVAVRTVAMNRRLDCHVALLAVNRSLQRPGLGRGSPWYVPLWRGDRRGLSAAIPAVLVFGFRL